MTDIHESETMPAFRDHLTSMTPEESTVDTGSSYPVFCPDLFMSDANSAYIYSEGQRYGQFLMNFLKESFPEIIVPENADCFYDDKKVKEFLHFVYSAPTSN